MKSIYTLVILSFIVCNKANYTPKEIIVFEHTGITESIFKPLLISTKKLYIPLNKYDIQELKRIKERTRFSRKQATAYEYQKENKKPLTITRKDAEAFTDLKYNKCITNTVTFSAIGKFVSGHPQYYVNKTNKVDQPGVRSFHIIYNGLTYSVYSKLSNQFLIDLKNYLILHNCDKKVIQNIVNLRY